MKYKIGRITTGIALVMIGLLIFLHQITDVNWLEKGFTFWPLILIGYGIEYLLYTRRNERISFDLGGAIFIAIVLGVTWVVNLISSGIQNYSIGEMDYARKGQEIIIEEQVNSLLVDGLIGQITLEPSSNGKITILPIYRSNKNLSLEKMKEELFLDVQNDNGKLNVKVDGDFDDGWLNLLKFTRVGIDLHIQAPAELLTEIEQEVGSIDIHNMENIRKVNTNIGDILVVDSKGNAEVQIDTGEVEIQGYEGSLDISNNLGSIIVEGEVEGKWDLRTNVGDIEVTIPEDGSYNYSFNVDFGDVNIANPPFQSGKSGVVNEGKNQLRLTVNMGKIVVNTK